MWDVRYRPLRFSDVLGQEGSIKLLKSRIKKGTAFDTSYIFAGKHGRGKTTLSRIYARAMLCQNLDKNDPEPCNECSSCKRHLIEQHPAFSERDAATNGSVDQIRSIVDNLVYALEDAPKPIYLIDEAHRLSQPAQDGLLKSVEEKRMVAMLCTNESEKIRGPIRSRCEEYTLRKVTNEHILERMQMVLRSEGVDFEDDAVLTVIDHSKSHVRDILNNLEMVAQMGAVTVANVQEYLHLSATSLYYQILLTLDNPREAIATLEQACEIAQPEEVASGLAKAAMSSYMLGNRMPSDFSALDRGLAEQCYARYKDQIIRFSKWFVEVKYPSKMSLMQDVIAFSLNPGSLPVDVAAPPVVFSSPVRSEAPVAPRVAPAVAPAPPLPPPPPVETSVAPKVAAPVVESPPIDIREIEDLADPTKPTEIEMYSISKQMPRQRTSTSPEPIIPKAKFQTQMGPNEWRDGFGRWMKKRAPRS